MNIEKKYRMKNQLTSEVSGYSVNNVYVITCIIHQELKHFVTNMPIFQKYTENHEDDKNRAPNVETQVQAKATLTTRDIKKLVKKTMKEIKPARHKSNPKTSNSQGTDDDGNKITYF